MLRRRAVQATLLVLPAAAGCSAGPGEAPIVPVSSASPVPESATSEVVEASAKPRAPAPPDSGAQKIGGGCEAVKAAYVQHCQAQPGDCAGKPGEEVSAGVYGAVLNRGSYLNACGVPSSMEVGICIAVINGRAAGITVTTSPRDPAIGNCVATAVGALAFPTSPTLDITRTTFAAQ